VAHGYEGTYRGSVVDDMDPMSRSRLRVLVPEVFAEESVWAEASLPAMDRAAFRMPTIGDEVWVSFERGDTDAPVWESSAVDAEPEGTTPGYGGKYRGVVLDNADPEGMHRLQLSVPEVSAETSVWASPAASAWNGDEIQTPAVGDEVWVEYENGDPLYPTWVGVAQF